MEIKQFNNEEKVKSKISLQVVILSFILLLSIVIGAVFILNGAKDDKPNAKEPLNTMESDSQPPAVEPVSATTQSSIDYIPIFESIYENCYRDTVADEVNFEVEQTLIEVRVENRELPSNGLDLYIEWRLTNHPLATNGQNQTAEDIYQAVNETVYTTGSANIRSGASTNDSIIKTASKGTSMTRTGIGSNGWSRVEFNGQTCYVSSDLLSTTKPTSGSGSGSSGGGSSQSKPQSGSQSGSSSQRGSGGSQSSSGGSQSSSDMPTIPGAIVTDVNIDDGLTPEERSARWQGGGSQGYTGEEFGGG